MDYICVVLFPIVPKSKMCSHENENESSENVSELCALIHHLLRDNETLVCVSLCTSIVMVTCIRLEGTTFGFDYNLGSLRSWGGPGKSISLSWNSLILNSSSVFIPLPNERTQI